ncbi:class 1 fructose-bisphosphatase [Tropicimonas sediminicola]|uniref:Fructose-1,6-bisphosphatase class 1 n=1 Tax=Tropicimonas sediminicola TaxID=1031541 RepID=A0A239F3F0_9RHOB|nr:class 1 fructose-bisphosphatase [Tropicimonas sediminicola]SNS51231.1 D-fructose 1,6-bisphosphatase [Tropicimonas sediminicola]
MFYDRLTLRRFLLQEYRTHGVEKDLVFLLEDIATACREISFAIRNGAFFGTLGSAASKNVQGETQKELDIFANDQFVSHIRNCSRVAALVSEEVEEVIWLKDSPAAGDYIVYFDPLDGSSNLDVNLSVGSIFSIVQLPEAIEAGDVASVLRPGTEQICAGYSIYGPATTLVITLGHGVHEFVNHLGTGEFRIVSGHMKVAEESAEFSINASRFGDWDAPVRRYIEECLEGEAGPRRKRFGMRWSGSMVVDIHRILTRGGVFLYPEDRDNRATGGKLRLLYEANPMGFLIEQAGGIASTGRARILEVQPTSIHQRTPVVLGSRSEVLRIEDHHTQMDGVAAAD